MNTQRITRTIPLLPIVGALLAGTMTWVVLEPATATPADRTVTAAAATPTGLPPVVHQEDLDAAKRDAVLVERHASAVRHEAEVKKAAELAKKKAEAKKKAAEASRIAAAPSRSYSAPPSQYKAPAARSSLPVIYVGARQPGEAAYDPNNGCIDRNPGFWCTYTLQGQIYVLRHNYNGGSVIAGPQFAPGKTFKLQGVLGSGTYKVTGRKQVSGASHDDALKGAISLYTCVGSGNGPKWSVSAVKVG